MQVELSNLHKDLGLTFILVTHDQEEALCQIAVMNQGKIEQVEPQQIYEQPRTPFVADFGNTNISGSVETQESSGLRLLQKQD